MHALCGSNTLSHAKWKAAMIDKIQLLDTLELTILPAGKRTVGCKWLYALKYNLDGLM